MKNSEILLYQTEDGQTKIDVRLEEETVWLSQKEMSNLFQKERSVITKHINNVFKEGELDEKSNVQILHIRDWIKKLNDFMTLNEKEILEHAGKTSAKMAKELSEIEYDKYREKMINIEDTKEITELEEGLRKLEN